MIIFENTRYNEVPTNEGVYMDEKLLHKMIQKCFLQYNHNLESVPLTKEEYLDLLVEIKQVLAINPNENLYDIINDLVYEYLTK
ncbi:YqzH-like protein [Litchfieldia salsa]|uniref:YqzH-like protein n=2 Tax=Litchfieldia salsa TaxID=930152 RepID=A0A1H0WHA5_9BACI|nr:YqzH-like protein [Litchfieldia salsa]